MREAKAVVVFLTQNSIKKPWPTQEMNNFLALGRLEVKRTEMRVAAIADDECLGLVKNKLSCPGAGCFLGVVPSIDDETPHLFSNT